MTRRERLERKLEKRGEWAGKASARSDAAFATAGNMAEAIPFGQPILVGHHSERRDRNYRGRIHAKMDKGLAEHKKAEHHESKARGLAIALERSIFDDDPDAIERLTAKVAELEAACERSLAVNKAWKKGGRAAVAEQFSENLAAAAEMNVKHQPWRKNAPFGNTHNRAEIRRCKERIAQIEKRNARVAVAEQSGGIVIAGSEKWALVTFAEKPDRSVLQELRAAGYTWGKGSWQGLREKLPESVAELARDAAESAKAEAGACLCSDADAYECAPCENTRQAEAEAEAEERKAS